MPKLCYAFAGGGTGGHLYPGLTVAEHLRAKSPDAEQLFLTTDRSLDRQLLLHHDFTQIVQPVRPVALQPWRWSGFWRAWRASVALARRVLLERRPRAVLGLGGYAAGPPIVAARSLNIPTAILNPDAIPGRANRFLARRVDLVLLQWEETGERLPRGARFRTVGCPIRSGFRDADRDSGCALFGLDPDRPVLLTTGASQGARTVNQAVVRVWPEFQRAHPQWQLLHLSGPADEQTLRHEYERRTAPATVVAFTHEMPAALAAADAVVSRAGASTLAELTALGKPAILLPYPYHRDQHQRANGRVLADRGAAILLEDLRDPAKNAPPLRAALERLVDADAREAMATAARALGRPDAGAAVAAWMDGG